MAFFGKYRRPELDEGKMDSVSKVETAGYIPADVQINMFIEAGRRLEQARKEQFDFAPEEEVPDDFIDPTRRGDFDLVDAQQISVAAKARIQSAINEGKKKKNEKPQEPLVEGEGK